MKKLNIGILAHVDAGKTTLTEQLLFHTGALRHPGDVDSGTCVTDSMSVERQRGISVRTACARAEWNGFSLCFIDTPGHVDFAGEVERSLGVLDGAVLVLSAVEGVEAHTKLIWNALRKLSIPTVIVINKIDRAGSDIKRVLENINSVLTPCAVPLESITGEGADCADVSLSDGSSPSYNAEEMLLAVNDDELTERYLSGTLKNEEILSAFARKCKSGKAFPVLFTSAKTGAGIAELALSLCEYLPDSSALEAAGTSGLVFKVEYDRDMGKAAYVRLFGGEIKNRDAVIFRGTETEKAVQIRTFDGARAVDRGVLSAGDCGIIYGLSGVKSGDTIGEDAHRTENGFATPLLTVTAHPENDDARAPLLDALRELSDEDPLLSLQIDSATREMHLQITGVIQLEVLEELIFDRYGMRVFFSEPSVIFKETPAREARGYESYTMPKPCWAQVELTVKPLPRGSGIKYKSVIKDNVMPYRYQHHTELSVMRDCICQGIYGWEVTDAEITLTNGGYHSIHTHPLDFFVATPIAFLRALTESGSVLLEPFVHVTLSADESLLGKVLGRIIDMRGEFEGPSIENGQFTLEAELPVQSSMDYPTEFRSLTSGKGIYMSAFSSYRECPKELYKTLPRRGPDPLDKPQWILYCRSALKD